MDVDKLRDGLVAWLIRLASRFTNSHICAVDQHEMAYIRVVGRTGRICSACHGKTKE